MEEIQIRSKNELLAIIIPHNYDKTGLNFVTEQECSFQMAYVNYQAGHEVERHVHPRFERIIKETLECIFVKKGKLSVSFYDESKTYVDDYVVGEGDTLLFISGGHSMKYQESTQLIEIRQGPYIKEMDKIKF